MEWTDRTRSLIGEDNLQTLKNASVVVVGLGGVGSFAAEAIARNGVGRIILVDKDRVDITNINRQLVALHSTVGKKKVNVMKKRIADIHPEAQVKAISAAYTKETEGDFDFSGVDVIIDAIDSIDDKVELIRRAVCEKIPIVSCMGAGNKMDPGAFEVADIADTSVCPLARVMRRRLREIGIEHVSVVYSREPPARTEAIGSVSFVPPVAGFMLASEAIRMILEKSEQGGTDT
ncbi:MAG: tRNA threonylcarbamoyladenosine dehydratase [Clostridiales bacterium]|nr:tRNA threonylcarbamoyladenosine dehydratase [Clostridiales bacterium]